MGVFGWFELQDNVEMTGIVESHVEAGDGDWTVKIKPDPAYAHLLVNRAGTTNHDGYVECEVEPIDWLASRISSTTCGVRCTAGA